MKNRTYLLAVLIGPEILGQTIMKPESIVRAWPDLNHLIRFSKCIILYLHELLGPAGFGQMIRFNQYFTLTLEDFSCILKEINILVRLGLGLIC